MSQNNLIDMMLGEESLTNQSARFKAWWVPRTNVREHAGLTECFISQAVNFKLGGMAQIGSPVISPAFNGIKQMFGQWTTVRFRIPDGEIIKLQGARSASGAVIAQANMYIQIRHNAALREVRTELTRQVKSLFPHAFVKGNFDILTTEQARAAGVFIPERFEAQCHPGRQRGAFTDIILEEERKALPRLVSTVAASVQTEDGQTVNVARPSHIIEER